LQFSRKRHYACLTNHRLEFCCYESESSVTRRASYCIKFGTITATSARELRQ